jgi:hypothetical protein
MLSPLYPCPERAICTDLCQGFECSCSPPYDFNVSGECCDVDQCQIEDACPEFSICSDSCVDYSCKCIDGYHFEGDLCVPDCDENQCENSPCPERSSCQNLCDGFECICDEPFEYNNGECCDHNQCTKESACPAYSACKNKCLGKVRIAHEVVKRYLQMYIYFYCDFTKIFTKKSRMLIFNFS